MFRPLHYILDRTVKSGHLEVVDAGGHSYGFGDKSGSPVVLRIADQRTEWELGLRPTLAVGEAYMEGRLTVEQGTIYDFFELLAANLQARAWPRWMQAAERLRFLTRRLRQINLRSTARRNVAHHYDLEGGLYGLFLDEDRQYSCAYFEDPRMSLDQAQLAKKRHLASKLRLQDGMKVLDIGSGWGGLALYLAEAGAGDVLGISLAEEQVKFSRERAERSGLGDRVRFELRDYRELTGSFERIVSVGMFEHVGVRYYRAFFRKVRELLTEDGVALLHAIGRRDGPGWTNPWLRKYIFPGGYAPALSEVLPSIEREGLWVTDIEVLRLHYADTLRLWRRRFAANRSRIAEIYDERFCRMWEFYLIGSELGFRRLGQMVFQIQLARRQDAVPLTRDYITERDASQAQLAAE
jgi:cyclopropane-fatty-acyl-phospholipid synthase